MIHLVLYFYYNLFFHLSPLKVNAFFLVVRQQILIYVIKHVTFSIYQQNTPPLLFNYFINIIYFMITL